jgi:hypothetical protein
MAADRRPARPRSMTYASAALVLHNKGRPVDGFRSPRTYSCVGGRQTRRRVACDATRGLPSAKESI